MISTQSRYAYEAPRIVKSEFELASVDFLREIEEDVHADATQASA